MRRANPKNEIKPWDILIAQIEQTEKEVFNIFFDAFPPTDKVIFCEIWNELIQVKNCFETINDLQKFYQNLLKNLPVHIEEFCQRLNVENKLSAQTIHKFSLIVKLHQQLMRQKFYLTLFRQGDELDEITYVMKNIKSDHVQLVKDMEALNMDEIENFYYAIEVVFNAIINELRKKGFGDIPNEFNSDIPLTIRVDLSKIFAQLDRIPDDLVRKASLLEIARKEGDKEEANQLRQELLEIVNNANDVVTKLGNVISDDLKKQALALQQFKEKANQLDSDFAQVKKHLQKVSVLQLISQLCGYQNDLKVDNGFYEIDEMIKQMQPDVKNKLATLFLPLVTSLDKFVKPYSNYMSEIKRIKHSLHHLEDQKQKIDTMRMMWAARRIKGEHAWQSCCEAIMQKKRLLQTYTENDLDFFRKFIANHKLPILCGSLGGTGTSVSLSYLLFSFEVVSTTIFTSTGFTVGLGLGALIGLTVDYVRHFKSGPPLPELSKQDQQLLQRKIFPDFPKDIEPDLLTPKNNQKPKSTWRFFHFGKNKTNEEVQQTETSRLLP